VYSGRPFGRCLERRCGKSNAGGYGEREFECGQPRSRHSDVDQFQTEEGITILHFSLDSFDISMASRTFCNINEPKKMVDYKPGTGRATGGMQYGGYSNKGENQVVRGSPIFKPMLRRIVD